MSERIKSIERIEISKVINGRKLELYRPDALGVTSALKVYEYQVELLEVIDENTMKIAIDIGTRTSPSAENPTGFSVDNSFVKTCKYKLDIKNILDGKPCVIEVRN